MFVAFGRVLSVTPQPKDTKKGQSLEVYLDESIPAVMARRHVALAEGPAVTLMAEYAGELPC